MSPTLEKLHHILAARRSAVAEGAPEALAVDPEPQRKAVRETELPFNVPTPRRVTYAPEPAAKRRARSFAALVAGLRFGQGPDAGPQLSGRAMAKLQRDPFVQRLARLH
ncbi:MAG: hypothetical protein AAGG09_19345 [Pseudomonadota bacterium]